MNIDAEQIMNLVKEMKGYFWDTEKAGQIREKGNVDYVTQVDLQVQSLMSDRLSQLYPDIQFMGEEKDNTDIDFSKAVWIMDPVDGTTNLIHGLHHSCLSLALSVKGELEIGIVYQPYTDELFFAEKGKGAFLNGKPIHVSAAKTMGDSLITVGTTPYRHDLAAENFDLFRRVFLDCHDIRRMGSAALDLAYVASGRIEAYFERGLSPWDYAAGVLLVKEAGGSVTSFEGGAVPLDQKCDIVGGNGVINKILVEEYF